MNSDLDSVISATTTKKQNQVDTTTTTPTCPTTIASPEKMRRLARMTDDLSAYSQVCERYAVQLGNLEKVVGKNGGRV